MQIRPLTIHDVEAFRTIRLESLREEPAAYASTLHDWDSLTRSEWENRLTANIVIGAFAEKVLVGMIGLSRQRASKMLHRATLIMVYVQKPFRGTNTARNLLDATVAEARAEGIRQLELAVSIENAAAIRFYEREGFSRIGQIPGGFLHESREIDEVLMARRIG